MMVWKYLSKVTEIKVKIVTLIIHYIFVTILPRHKSDASGKIVTRIHVYLVTLQIIH